MTENEPIQLPRNHSTYQLISLILAIALSLTAWITFFWDQSIGNAGANLIVLVFLLLVGVVGPHQLSNGKIPRYIPGFSQTVMKKGPPGRMAHITIVMHFIIAIFIIIANFLLWISWIIPLLWSAAIELVGALSILVGYWRYAMSKTEETPTDPIR